MFQVIVTPARPLLLQQWVAPRDYGWVNSVALSQHRILLAVAVSTSALLILAIGRWRLAYFVQGRFMAVQALAWIIVARESLGPVKTLERALRARKAPPQGPSPTPSPGP